ncbi:hypothetical protein GCM10027268_17190 [Brachybacterium huguangmaarense]
MLAPDDDRYDGADPSDVLIPRAGGADDDLAAAWADAAGATLRDDSGATTPVRSALARGSRALAGPVRRRLAPAGHRLAALGRGSAATTRRLGTAVAARLPEGSRPVVHRALGAGAVAALLLGTSFQAVSAVDRASAPAADAAVARVGHQDESLLLAMDARDGDLLDRAAALLAPPADGAAAPDPATAADPGAAPLVAAPGLAVDGSMDIIKPVAGAVEGSGFGMRFHPVLHEWKMHNGTDFPVACGTPVYAAADGTVTLAEYHGPSGNAVWIDHGDLNGGGPGADVVTHYFHLSAFGVRPGDHVVQGQFVGLSGTTGRSTGCHLHFEVLIDGVPVDPMSVIGGGEPVYGTEAPGYGKRGATWSPDVPAAEDEQYKREAETEGDAEGAAPAPATAAPAAPRPAPTESPRPSATPSPTSSAPSDPPSTPVEEPSESPTAPAPSSSPATTPVTTPTDTPTDTPTCPPVTGEPVPSPTPTTGTPTGTACPPPSAPAAGPGGATGP